jgi:hypothetical protein
VGVVFLWLGAQATKISTRLLKEWRRAAATAAAEVVQSRAGAKITALVFTVGILGKKREETVDGIARETMLIYLCRFMLLNTLLPEVAASGGLKPRVLNLATASLPALAIDYSDFQWKTRPWDAFGAHKQTILANDLMVIEAAHRNPHVVFVGLNPGKVSTEVRRANRFVPGWADRIFEKTLAVRQAGYVQSSLVNATVSLSVDSLSGLLLGPRN